MLICAIEILNIIIIIIIITVKLCLTVHLVTSNYIIYQRLKLPTRELLLATLTAIPTWWKIDIRDLILYFIRGWNVLPSCQKYFAIYTTIKKINMKNLLVDCWTSQRQPQDFCPLKVDCKFPRWVKRILNVNHIKSKLTSWVLLWPR